MFFLCLTFKTAEANCTATRRLLPPLLERAPGELLVEEDEEQRQAVLKKLETGKLTRPAMKHAQKAASFATFNITLAVGRRASETLSVYLSGLTVKRVGPGMKFYCIKLKYNDGKLFGTGMSETDKRTAKLQNS